MTKFINWLKGLFSKMNTYKIYDAADNLVKTITTSEVLPEGQVSIVKEDGGAQTQGGGGPGEESAT